ncbi:MAG: LacI family DNA-binding transcriptional regulator [Calditrichaeota bacterium]|nr:LacI family DNA-binding transcriptional regulator [Calditrichota bacterium]
MSTTIRDVAKKANVSTATVSLVINNHKRISPATRAKVLSAIKTLDYHPSRSARGLVSNRTGNIGFILREDHFSKSEPFYTKVFLGTEFEAREHEFYVLLTTVSPEFHKGEVLPRFVLERNVDGIIIAGKVPQELTGRLSEYKLPLVFADYYPPEGKYSMVLIDNIAGGTDATTHLIQRNHRNIAFVGGDIEHPSILERLQGYKIALEKANIPVRNEWIITDAVSTNTESGYLSAKHLFDRNPGVTAVFCCNDAMGIGVIKYLKEKGLRVPQDISVIGFDDVEMSAFIDPPLTTMRVPKEEVGVHAMRLIRQVIQTDAKPHKILVPVKLIERESTRQL